MQVQRRCRITACRRLDQRLEIGEQRGVLGNRRFASGSRPPDPLRGLVSRQFLQTPPDRARRNPGCHRDRRDPAITRGERLGRRDQTAAPFIEKRGHRRKPPSDGSDIDHYHNIWYSSEVIYLTLSKVDSIIFGRALTISVAREGAADFQHDRHVRKVRRAYRGGPADGLARPFRSSIRRPCVSPIGR